MASYKASSSKFASFVDSYGANGCTGGFSFSFFSDMTFEKVSYNFTFSFFSGSFFYTSDLEIDYTKTSLVFGKICF